MRLILLIALVLPSLASAIVFGGSNLSFLGYPSPNCIKPMKPFKPYSINNQWEVDLYNNEVNSFNRNYAAYIDCVNSYLESGVNDIKRIKEKMESVLNETKEF